MKPMDERRRVQVDIPQDALNILEDLAHDIRKSSDDRRVGTGTIAARLLESLVAHPEIIEQLLSEYARNSARDPPLAAEQKTEYEIKHPKGKTARRG